MNTKDDYIQKIAEWIQKMITYKRSEWIQEMITYKRSQKEYKRWLHTKDHRMNTKDNYIQKITEWIHKIITCKKITRWMRITEWIQKIITCKNITRWMHDKVSNYDCIYRLNTHSTDHKESQEMIALWMHAIITWLQPWCNPSWLTGLKARTN